MVVVLAQAQVVVLVAERLWAVLRAAYPIL